MIDKFKFYNDYMNYEYVFVSPNADVSGEVLEKSDIDSIKIMGLKQDTFEYFVEKYGKQFRAIYFFKN